MIDQILLNAYSAVFVVFVICIICLIKNRRGQVFVDVEYTPIDDDEENEADEEELPV